MPAARVDASESADDNNGITRVSYRPRQAVPISTAQKSYRRTSSGHITSRRHPVDDMSPHRSASAASARSPYPPAGRAVGPAGWETARHAHHRPGRRRRRRPVPARAARPPATATPDLPTRPVTVIGNTGDDITLFGLRVCPDLDTVMYTLGGGINEAQGWGRADETHAVQGELAAYGAVAAVVRPRRPRLRHPRGPQPVARPGLSRCREVTARLAARWGLPDQRGHAAADDRHPGRDPRGRRRGRRSGRGGPLPGVVGAACGPRCRRSGSWRSAWTGRRPPPASWTRSGRPTSCCCRRATRSSRSGSSSACRGCATPCAAAARPVVGVSPLIGGAPGARARRRLPVRDRGRLDRRRRWPGCTPTSWTAGWSTSPTRSWPTRRAGSGCVARPLWMHDVPSTADIAGAALDLAAGLRDDAV